MQTSPGQTDMGVPPFFASNTQCITFSHIHSTKIADLTINDHQLAVVAVVQRTGIGSDPPHLPPCLFQFPEQRAHEGHKAPKAIIEKLYLKALAGLFFEDGDQLLPHGIIMNRKILHMNMVLRLSEIIKKLGELGLSVGKDVHRIVVRINAPAPELMKPLVSRQLPPRGIVALAHNRIKL